MYIKINITQLIMEPGWCKVILSTQGGATGPMSFPPVLFRSVLVPSCGLAPFHYSLCSKDYPRLPLTGVVLFDL